MSSDSSVVLPSLVSLAFLRRAVASEGLQGGRDPSAETSYVTSIQTQDETSSSSGLSATGTFLVILFAVLLVHLAAWCLWRNRQTATQPDKEDCSNRRTRWSTLLISLVLTAASFALAVTSTISCRFFVIERDYSIIPDHALGYGLFRYESLTPEGIQNNDMDATVCISYPEQFRDEYFEGALPIARWMSAFSCAFLGLALLALLGWAAAAAFAAHTNLWWRAARVCTYVGLYPTALVFFAHGWKFCDESYRWSGDCEIDRGGVLHATNVALVAILVVLGFVLPAFTKSNATSHDRESTEQDELAIATAVQLP